MKDILEKPSVLVAAVLLLLGLVFSLMPFAAFEAQWFMASVFCIAAGLFASMLNGVCPAVFWGAAKLPLAVLFALWAVALASVIFSEVRLTAAVYAGFFSVFPLAALLVLVNARQPVFMKIVAGGLAAFFILLALLSLAQYFVLTDMLSFGRVAAPLADPNALGGLLSFGFFGFLGVSIAVRSKILSVASAVLAAIVFAALLTTGSRGATLSLLICIPPLLFLLRHRVRARLPELVLLLVLCAAAFGGISMARPMGASSPAHIVSASVEGSMPLLWSRPAIWESALNIAQDHLWTGTGIGTFFLYYPAYRGADDSSAGLMAHNDILQFLSETGIFGALAFCFLGVAVAMRTLQNARKADSDRAVWLAVPACAIGAAYINSLIGFNFHVLPVLICTGVFLGFWLHALNAGSEQDKAPCRESGFWGAFVLIILTGLFAAVQGSVVLTGQAEVKLAAGDLEGFARDVNRAERLSMHMNDKAPLLAASLPLATLEAEGSRLDPLQRAIAMERVERLLDKARSRNPRLPVIPYMKARAIFANTMASGREAGPEATALLEEALALDPLYIPARMVLADVLNARGRASEALKVLGAGLTWPYSTPLAMRLYEKTALLALENGQMDLHRQALYAMNRARKREKKAPRRDFSSFFAGRAR